ncbi:polyprenyl synthetase family protein [Candidatus Saccharibacteria bacterium]|nr:polyprenyl synthetase family protein [Candidatus Saccharibacteria bacterium]
MRVFVSYKKLINSRLEKITKDIVSESSEHGGSNGRLLAEEFTAQLNGGGKRLRGALLMFSYEASGGRDSELALQVACAIEMMHAYILMVDDIQDRSAVRHGQATSHVRLSKELGDEYIGMSIAINAALYGMHQAEKLLTSSGVSQNIIEYINDTMITTAYGQTADVLNDTRGDVSYNDVLAVADAKTARYSFENPLAVGILLAGKEVPGAIKGLARHIGRAFQTTDDMLGMFGDEQVTGKSPLDDIREGKRTLLSIYALENLVGQKKLEFKELLGKKDITEKEFKKAQVLVKKSGAVEFVKNAANKEAEAAKKALKKMDTLWSGEAVATLSDLVDSIIVRSK